MKLGKELDLSLVFVAASYNEAMRRAHQLSETAPAGPIMYLPRTKHANTTSR
jgi:hypothetical protein